MFVLGVDPGLTTAGYGVIEVKGTAARAVAAGVIRTSPQDEIAVRLMEIHRDLSDLIAEYQPAEAAIEEVFVNRNLHTATAVGRASGVALLAIAQAGVPVSEYTPSAVKMALCGNGRAPKDQMQKVVSMRLGLSGVLEPPDAADALAVALCHTQHAPMRSAVDRAT
jgi:crossover junction endodeoxyribonuclease RuvC